MNIAIEEVAQILKERDSFLILCHKNPDGDAIGSGYALYYALKQLGKRVSIGCSDPFPDKYKYMFDEHPEKFEPQYIISVDVADDQLLGDLRDKYTVNLSIDHHISHRTFAQNTHVRAEAAATAEIIFEIILMLNVEMDQNIANCIYTGLATDTGCFRYSNTTSNTHAIASITLQMGAEHAKINSLMFESKSKKKLFLERKIFDRMEFYENDKISVLKIPKELVEQAHDEMDMFDGISAMSRQIEGVEIGITIRFQQKGVYKISLRTTESVDASAVCQEFGGGGHVRAAGCTIRGSLEDVKKKIVHAASQALIHK